jgi:hypothetical protein
MEDREFLERNIYESALLRMETMGTKSIMTPTLIEKRESIKSSLLKYYEKTEEFEKCKFITDFFNRLEKEILINRLFDFLRKEE